VLYLTSISQKILGDRVSVPMEHLFETGHGQANGHVTADVT